MESQELDPAACLERSEEVLDAPSLKVPANPLGRGFGVFDGRGDKQEPLHRIFTFRRVGLDDMDTGRRDGLALPAGVRRGQGHRVVSELTLGHALLACRTTRLPRRLGRAVSTRSVTGGLGLITGPF